MMLPRGFRDLEPDEYELMEVIREAFKKTCNLYGFQIMEPSTLESMETLEAKSGPSIKDEIYFFKDKGGRNVGLRFDLTVGLTRYVCSRRDLPLPMKLASFADVWRYDEPQRARYRWFYQWDAEIYGPKNYLADAEIIIFTTDVFHETGLRDIEIKIGDRRMIQSLIKNVTGLNDEKVIELMRALDKVDRKRMEDIIDEYRKKGLREEDIVKVLQLSEVEGDLNNLLNKFDEGIFTDEIIALSDMLKSNNISFTISAKIVRGLDYYTSIVFEVFYKKNRQIGAIAGGGRYDILTSIFGRSELGATGVAGGVERHLMALRKENVKPEREKGVYIAYMKGYDKKAFEIARRMRNKGIPAVMNLVDRGLSKQLEEADRRKVPFVVMILPREIEEGCVVLKDMDQKEEMKIKIDEIEKYIRR